MRRPTALAGILLAIPLFAFGCGRDQAEAPPAATAPPPATAATTAQTTEAGDLPVFRNARGQITCPVMGAPIPDEGSAVGFVDHAGKRYYFCCGGCPEEFKKHPEVYEDGKNLKG